ncbi:Qat anti-phage system TatD family nuclease QatD [Daejeonella sp.]|uniref:Qat anti-phage system TatD family nuclease QatD n=1 Tax=Daejeonella sp. TaxID=2805397 RepID=UPI0030BFBA44
MITNFYIDTHCHLDLFKNIQQQAIHEDNQPIKTITVTNAPSFYKANTALFRKAKNIRVGIGLHPELTGQFSNQVEQFEKDLNLTRYIGEIGLDGSSRFRNFYDLQWKTFNSLLNSIAKTDKKILTVHSRNAAGETIDLIDKYLWQTSNSTILHWYTGDKVSLVKAVNMGFYFSFNHKMLQSPKGIEMLKLIPAEKLLTETDAPFTFDERVKSRLHSLEFTIKTMAKLLNKDITEVQSLIYHNFRRLLV